MGSLTMKKLLIAGAVASAIAGGAALADQIGVPNQFVAGTTARASEVNENFSVLAEESNAQDLRITALEEGEAGPVEQLICIVAYNPQMHDRSGFPFPRMVTSAPYVPTTQVLSVGKGLCLQTDDPTVVRELSLQEITAEGWRLFNSDAEHYYFQR